MSSTKIFFVVLALSLFAGVVVRAMDDVETECGDILKKGRCRNSDDKLGFDCYWNPMDGMCVEPPSNCTDVYDKKHCNHAMALLDTEDNCVWDNEELECIVPAECEDLNTKAKCMKYEMYPTVDVTGGACKYNKNRGCFLNMFPTSCEEVPTAKQCRNSEKRFGFECFYDAKECIEPPTTCDEISGKSLCREAYAKVGFPCFFQNQTCSEAPTDCESLASRNKCLNAADDLGIVGCAWMEGECMTITCEDIPNKGMCLDAEELYSLSSCYFDKPSQSCMTLE